MNSVLLKTVSILTPVLAYGLTLVCPAIPTAVWSALITAILDEKITLQHITDFMKQHDIHTYSNPEDFPKQKSNFGG